MLTVSDKLLTEGSKVFYKESFRRLLEEHMSYFRDSESIEEIIIEPDLLNKFEHNLYGYLNAKKYPRQYHWVIMRVNGMHNSSEFNKNTKNLLIPNFGRIDNLVKIFNIKK